MANRIFTTTEKAWQGMLAGIKSAEKSIYLEMYIFEDDVVGNNFLSDMVNAALKDIKVVIILDVVASHALSSNAIEKLRGAGAEVLFYSFLLRRTHRKILIIDEKTAYVGGVNIKKTFASWKDLQIRVTGRVVKHIVRSFARVYAECGGKDATLANTSKQSVFLRAKLWFIERGVGRREKYLRNYYEKRIDNAKHSIIFITPYLLPPRWFIAHIHQALIRGVKIEILMPNASDHFASNRLNRSFSSFLTELGAQCYFAPGTMNHSKALLIDDQEGMIGSQNLDFFSFSFNTEAGIFFSEQKTVKALAKIINEWKTGAELFEKNTAKFHWYDIVLAFLLRLLGFLPFW